MAPFKDSEVRASAHIAACDDPLALMFSDPYYLSSAARWNLGGVSG